MIFIAKEINMSITCMYMFKNSLCHVVCY
ncbi:hypothetical protein F383_28056 [Gossypium arboreum]|uniref:Uncharacterized protein n=1 Tax=Gossypium arboreum TaxID=29729 RepID=A0A0B0PB37_GOSAR|nr:hypothetical protein F383_28056 [Gossypium arboreum]